MKLQKSNERPILLSIQTEHVTRILSGEKSVEFRRRAPQQSGQFEAVIYSSRKDMAIKGVATIGEITNSDIDSLWIKYEHSAGITQEYFRDYFQNCTRGYALVIRSLEIFDSPVSLADMRTRLHLRPPQSWQYLSHETLRQILELGRSSDME